MKLIQRIKEAVKIIIKAREEQPDTAEILDVTVVEDEGKIPDVLHSTFEHRNVTREFVTEDNMDDLRILYEKVYCFLKEFGMDPLVVKFFVLIIRNPQTNWGMGFPYQVKIYAFPKHPVVQLETY